MDKIEGTYFSYLVHLCHRSVGAKEEFRVCIRVSCGCCWLNCHWCQQVCVSVSWCPLRSLQGLSKCQCQRIPFDFVQAQVWSPWSPWDNGKIPEHLVEWLSTPKLVQWFPNCVIGSPAPQPCPITLECVLGGLKKLEESEWPFQWSFACYRGPDTLGEA